MKKKKFALSGILKVREYEETLAVREFLEKTKKDRQLSSQYNDIQTNKANTMKHIGRDAVPFEQMRYAYNYIEYCNELQRDIQAQRDAIKPAVTQAHETYNAVRLALESVKVLQAHHKEAEKKMKIKDFYNQMQEGVLL